MRQFDAPGDLLAGLDPAASAALISAAADVTLVLDEHGTIVDLAVHSRDLARDLGDTAAWIGQPLDAIVLLDSRPKVEALLRDAASPGKERWRHVNHPGRGDAAIPVLYRCVALERDRPDWNRAARDAPQPQPAPRRSRLIAFGRDLRDLSQLQQRLVAAQQSMDRDYAKLRDAEMRYRLLFQLSTEAVLLIDAARLRVTEANPQARTLFGVEVGDLAGLGLAQLFADDALAAVETHLSAARAGVRVDDAAVQIVPRGQPPRDVRVKASFFRQEGEAQFLVRIAPTAAAAELPDAKAKLLSAIERAPDGFVVADDQGRVVSANAAFLELAQVAHEESIRGRGLENWIGRSGVDVPVLLASLRSRGSLRFFMSTVHGERGGATQVEISAASARAAGDACYGFMLRNVEPRLVTDAAPPARALSRSVEQLTELIGQVPLKDLVREATEVIEKLCIEAALDLTGDNRASAAEMLGLSRQSLYVKLRRYGLGDLAAADDQDE